MRRIVIFEKTNFMKSVKLTLNVISLCSLAFLATFSLLMATLLFSVGLDVELRTIVFGYLGLFLLSGYLFYRLMRRM